MASTVAQRLGQRERPPLVLDGGLATELERRGQDVSGALWSAGVLQAAPDQIRAAHLAYFTAGAEVATTASYQVTYAGFAAIGVSQAQTTELLERSVHLAQLARAGAAEADAAGGRPVRTRWVAASVGPYGAMLADGSEYTGDYDLDRPQLRAFHRPRLQVLADACREVPDSLLACETIPSLIEVEALAAELTGLGVPAWVSVTPQGDRLRSGEPLRAAFDLLGSVPEVVAVGVNCCDPRDVDLAIAVAAEMSLELPLIAYPNTGESWDATRRVWHGRVTLDADRARGWADAGARALGGCCRVGPALLEQIAQAIG